MSSITQVRAPSSSPVQEKVSPVSPSAQLDRNSAIQEEARRVREMALGRSTATTDASPSPVVVQDKVPVDSNSLMKEEAK